MAWEMNKRAVIKVMDLKNVISGLEGLTWDDWRDYHSDSEVINIAREAIELLETNLCPGSAVVLASLFPTVLLLPWRY